MDVDWFTREIDLELRSDHPPSGEMIVCLYLTCDTEFMVDLLKRNRHYRSRRGTPRDTIVAVSHDPNHPLYNKVKLAFDYAQKRRQLAGFPADAWPMQYEPPVTTRRLLWEPVSEDIREAWRLFHRFIREGFKPFSVDSEGNPLLPVTSFEPQCGELFFRSGDK